MVTLAPGSVVPSMVGLVCRVMLSPWIPLSEAGSSQTLISGAWVSMATEMTVGSLWLPATSQTTTLMSFLPSGSGLVGVTDQLPFASALAVTDSPVGNVTMTVAPGSEVPSIAGVVSLVRLSPLVPESEFGSSQVLACSALVSISTEMTVG